MHSQKWLLFLVNLIGGIAVLGSYVLGFAFQPNASQVLWGQVPAAIRPLYTVFMFLAALGYFAIIYFILFRLNAQQARIAGKLHYSAFAIIFAGILVPSALWLPLTFLAVEQSSTVLLFAVRVVLWLVAISSLALYFAIQKVEPRHPLWAHWMARIGSISFCVQTVLLDAIVWVYYFKI